MTPYDKYKESLEWATVEKAINDLVANQDIEVTTQQEYVVGYVTKEIVESRADSDLRTKVILSANRALWGAVTALVRGITIDYSKEKLTLRAYFDKGATESDKELIDDAMGEMMADLYPQIEQWNYEPIDLPYPNKMEVLKDWIYLRHENTEDQFA
jgi:hypothetical protein